MGGCQVLGLLTSPRSPVLCDKESSPKFSEKRKLQWQMGSRSTSSYSRVLKRLFCLPAAFSNVAADITIRPRCPLKRGKPFSLTKTVQTDICTSGNPFRALLSLCGGWEGEGRMEVPEAVGSRWHGGTTGPDLFHLKSSHPEAWRGKFLVYDAIIIVWRLICAGNQSCRCWVGNCENRVGKWRPGGRFGSYYTVILTSQCNWPLALLYLLFFVFSKIARWFFHLFHWHSLKGLNFNQ